MSDSEQSGNTTPYQYHFIGIVCGTIASHLALIWNMVFEDVVSGAMSDLNWYLDTLGEIMTFSPLFVASGMVSLLVAMPLSILFTSNTSQLTNRSESSVCKIAILSSGIFAFIVSGCTMFFGILWLASQM